MSELLSPRDEIEPVWSRIPQFFAYPLKPAALAVLAGFTVLYGLSYLPLSVVSLLLRLLAWMGLYKYAYEILAHTAQGNMEPPETAYITETDFVAFKHVGLLLLMSAVIAVVGIWTESWALMRVTSLLFALAWPAAIITLALTGNFVEALNPVTWVSVMTRVGWPYLAASVFLLMMQSSKGVVVYVFVVGLGAPGLVAGLGAFFISAYFLIAGFHLMGYVVYQRHDELGVAVDEPLPGRGSADEEGLAETRALIQDGRVDEAIDKLGAQIKREGGTQPVHDQYRKLLKLQERKAELVEHDREYVGILLEGFNEPRKALQVTEECLRLEPSFQPVNANQAAELVIRGAQSGFHEVVTRLGEPFLEQYPNHSRAPEVAFLVARTLSERYGKDEKALRLLTELQGRRPDHPWSTDVTQLIATLKDVMSKS